MDFSDRSDEIKEELGILRKALQESSRSKIKMGRTDAVKTIPKKTKNPKKLALTNRNKTREKTKKLIKNRRFWI